MISAPHPVDATAATFPAAALTTAELRAEVSARSPRLRFVSERVVRRVIRGVSETHGLSAATPHLEGWVASVGAVERWVDADELDRPLPAGDRWVLLAASPDEDTLASESPQETRWRWSRRLFHLVADATLRTRLQGASLGEDRVLAHIDALGQTPWDEARAALLDEGRTAEHDPVTLQFGEFIALYGELLVFEPDTIPVIFPGIAADKRRRRRAEKMVRALIDLEAIREATFLAGAAPPPEDEPLQTAGQSAIRPISAWRARRAMRRARRLLAAGQCAAACRAAARACRGPQAIAERASELLSAAAEGFAEQLYLGLDEATEREPGSEAAARRDDPLANAASAAKGASAANEPRGDNRAQDANEAKGDSGAQETNEAHVQAQAAAPKEAASTGAWAQVLIPLSMASGRGMRSVEARLLHDLARSHAMSREAARRIELIPWALSLGKHPLVSSLPTARLVRITRQLAKAKGRAHAIRVRPEVRRQLAALLTRVHRSWRRQARAAVGQRLSTACDDAGLIATTRVEAVSRDKLTEELVDTIVERGFATFGDVRDAIARNQLKLDDVTGARQFITGDTLLVLNRRLSKLLPGLYRPGEVYRRGLQRLSAAAFANPIGRALVRFAILPFGAAFVALEGLQHIVGPLAHWLTGSTPHIFSVASFLVTGAVLLGLIHLPLFRRVVWETLLYGRDALKLVAIRIPSAISRWRPVAWLRRTRLWRLVRDWVVRPALLVSLPTFVVASAAGWPLRRGLYLGLAGVGVSALFFNSRLGRHFRERFADLFFRAWRRIRYGILPNTLDAITGFFRRVLEIVEIALYRLDQWRLLHQGDSRWLIGFKAVFGVFWAAIAYLVRLYVNLLIEPQINPIKHFPVVTVSHKIILPMTPTLTGLFATPLAFLGPVLSNTVAATTVVLLPGVFGFLVWEFKETWRLYRANRRQVLVPVRIGAHGETMARFIRPGFHSGTAPRIYRKLRKAHRRSDAIATRHQRQHLHHAQAAVADFIQRELVGLWRAAGVTFAEQMHVSNVVMTPNRVAVSVACEGLDGGPAVLHFDEQSRWLLADVAEAGWIDALSDADRRILGTALVGLYKLSGVDLVRGELRSLLPEGVAYDVDERGLVIWPDEAFNTEIRYPLRTRHAVMSPRVRTTDGRRPAKGWRRSFREMTVEQVVFRRRAITWERWSQAWEQPPTNAPLADIIAIDALIPQRPKGA